MRARGESRAAGTLLAAIAALIPACFHDSSPQPTRAPLVFESLLVPAELGVDAGGAIEVSFYVGPSGCWYLEELDVSVEGQTIRVSGNSIFRNGGCSDAEVRRTSTLPFPSVPQGTYTVIAGEMTAQVTITSDSPTSTQHFVYVGDLSDRAEGCALESTGHISFVLHGLPQALPDAEYYVVRGSVVDQTPCVFPGPVDWVDYYVEVTAVEPRSSTGESG